MLSSRETSITNMRRVRVIIRGWVWLIARGRVIRVISMPIDGWIGEPYIIQRGERPVIRHSRRIARWSVGAVRGFAKPKFTEHEAPVVGVRFRRRQGLRGICLLWGVRWSLWSWLRGLCRAVWRTTVRAITSRCNVTHTCICRRRIFRLSYRVPVRMGRMRKGRPRRTEGRSRRDGRRGIEMEMALLHLALSHHLLGMDRRRGMRVSRRGSISQVRR